MIKPDFLENFTQNILKVNITLILMMRKYADKVFMSEFFCLFCFLPEYEAFCFCNVNCLQKDIKYKAYLEVKICSLF